MLIQDYTITETMVLLFAGAIGALTKDCINDNTLELPFVHEKKLYLGFIGAALIGSFIGYVIDGGFLTAMMGGYTGKSILASLLLNGKTIKAERKQSATDELNKAIDDLKSD